MGIVKIDFGTIVGTSNDVKPILPLQKDVGTKFYEKDTGLTYVWSDTKQWELYYNPVYNQPPTGLEKNGLGWSFIGTSAAGRAPIGNSSVDFSSHSYYSEAGNIHGPASVGSFNFGGGNRLPAGGGNYGAHFAVGAENYVFGYYNNMAFGVGNTINDGYSVTAIGYKNTASMTPAVGHGLVAGIRNSIYNYWTSALGAQLISKGKGQVSVGVGNTDYTGSITAPTRPMFVVGIGDANANSGGSYGNIISRKDGFVVRADGAVYAPSITNTLIDAVGAKSLISKEYLDSMVGGNAGSLQDIHDGDQGTNNFNNALYVQSTGGSNSFTLSLEDSSSYFDIEFLSGSSYYSVVTNTILLDATKGYLQLKAANTINQEPFERSSDLELDIDNFYVSTYNNNTNRGSGIELFGDNKSGGERALLYTRGGSYLNRLEVLYPNALSTANHKTIVPAPVVSVDTNRYLNLGISDGTTIVYADDKGVTDISGLNLGFFSTGLEAIDQGNGRGWRLVGRDPQAYGTIGAEAVDISFGTGTANAYGALGYNSFASGTNNVVSGARAFVGGIDNTTGGSNSLVFGQNNNQGGTNCAVFGSNNTVAGQQILVAGSGGTAQGNGAFVAGFYNFARSFAEISIGANGTDRAATNGTAFNINDRLFNIGNGANAGSPSDAFTIEKSGEVKAPSLTIALIDSAGNRVLTTKEWVLANASGGIGEAPNDGQEYVRKNQGWAVNSGGAGVPEAPNDGQQYVRKDEAWSVLAVGASNGITQIGGTVELGGALTKSTTINSTNNHSFTYRFSNNVGEDTYTLSEFKPFEVSLKAFDTVNGTNAFMTISDQAVGTALAELGINSGGAVKISFAPLAAKLQGPAAGFAGLEYTLDFRSAYTDRSLIDKKYAEDIFAAKSVAVTNETDAYGTPKVQNVVSLTQSEYDAIGTKGENTLYIIV